MPQRADVSDLLVGLCMRPLIVVTCAELSLWGRWRRDGAHALLHKLSHPIERKNGLEQGEDGVADLVNGRWTRGSEGGADSGEVG